MLADEWELVGPFRVFARDTPPKKSSLGAGSSGPTTQPASAPSTAPVLPELPRWDHFDDSFDLDRIPPGLFAGTPHEEEIRNAKRPGEAAMLGRDRNKPLRADWEEVKDDVMREALMAKFTRHADLRENLLWTGSAERKKSPSWRR